MDLTNRNPGAGNAGASDDNVLSAKKNNDRGTPPQDRDQPHRCKQCGSELRPRNHNRGRPRQFCSDACRKAYTRLNGQKHPTLVVDTGGPFSGLQATDLPGDFCPEIDISKKKLPWFEQVNDVTIKLTDGEQSNIPSSHGNWAGYRTTKALAWVIEISTGHWIARLENMRSSVTTLVRAKACAVAMASRSMQGRLMADSVTELNALRAVIESHRDWHPAKLDRATWWAIVNAEMPERRNFRPAAVKKEAA
jgi:hypothetical protein